jgi:hypothetical protein
VEKSGMRIKPGQDQGSAHLRLQDAIPIIARSSGMMRATAAQ